MIVLHALMNTQSVSVVTERCSCTHDDAHDAHDGDNPKGGTTGYPLHHIITVNSLKPTNKY